jgi:glycosyltransferase involved in cell wall biosynthesis
MKVLLYGETSNQGSGAWCYARTITEMGYELIEYSDSAYLEKYGVSLFWKALRRLNKRRLLEADRKKHINGLFAIAEKEKPDFIIILKGLHFSKADIENLKLHSPFVVNINHDDFFSFNINNRSVLQFEAIEAYDYIFTTREVNVTEIFPINKYVEFFPFAYYPGIHKKYVLNAEENEFYASEVLFIGTYEKERASFLEKLVTDDQFDLAIYGKGWNKLGTRSPLRKYLKSDHGLWMGEMAKAIGASKITLGFLRKENRDEYTQRSFEIPACGGLLLAEDTPFHRKLYLADKEAVFFDPAKPESLKEKIIWLLDDEERREKIKNAGIHKLQQGNFTYHDRINQLLEKYYAFKRTIDDPKMKIKC